MRKDGLRLDSEVGPLHLSGTAAFALSISTVDADTDGNGSADLVGATLTTVAACSWAPVC